MKWRTANKRKKRRYYRMRSIPSIICALRGHCWHILARSFITRQCFICGKEELW